MRHLLPLLALLASGCASQREVGLSRVTSEDVRIEVGAAADDEDRLASHWKVIQGTFDTEPARPVRPVRKPAPRPVRRPPPRPAAVPSRPKIPAPTRRAAKPARERGKKTGKTVEQLARDHFLDFPTRVVARRITFYCPSIYASEVRLTGDSVDRSRPRSHRADGNARLILRELTLEAERLTFKVRNPDDKDLQITARGNVQFASRVRQNVHREEGLKSLLITNDQTVPLR